jgi:hypothetical protein
MAPHIVLLGLAISHLMNKGAQDGFLMFRPLV